MAAATHVMDNPKLQFLNTDILVSWAEANKTMVRYHPEIDTYLNRAFENSVKCLGMIHNLHLSLEGLPILVCKALQASDLFTNKSNNSFMDTLNSNSTIFRQFVEGVNWGFQIVTSLSRLYTYGSEGLYKIKSYLISMSARRYFQFVGH